MAVYDLSNSQLRIAVNSFGAELRSVKNAVTGREYMWDAKPEFWKRTSPVLFPIVGSLNKGVFRYNGTEYPMSQHGFARDMEFELASRKDEELIFRLEAAPETLEKYPFQFCLEAGYRLAGNNLTVFWNVYNRDDKEMYFSIGGHPAFLCPLNDEEKQTDCRLLFDTKDMVKAAMIGKGGTLSSCEKTFNLKDGYMDITADLFDEDALIIENDQAHRVSLCGREGRPYLTVSFDAPLFGLWSPPRKCAPFICIEPWYGRCDSEDFEGGLSERAWGNRLAPSDVFRAEYTICVEML